MNWISANAVANNENLNIEMFQKWNSKRFAVQGCSRFSWWDIKPLGLFKQFCPEYFDHVMIFRNSKYLYVLSFCDFLNFDPYNPKDDFHNLALICKQIDAKIQKIQYIKGFHPTKSGCITIRLCKK